MYFVRSDIKEHEGIYLGTLDDTGKEIVRQRVVASSSSGLFVPEKPRAATGHLLWVRDGRLVARQFDAERGELEGDAVDLEVPVRVLTSHRATLASASVNGVLVSSPPEPIENQVVWFDRSGGGPHALRFPKDGTLGWPTVSPDGRLLAVQVTQGGNADLWVHDLATGSSNPLTSGDRYDRTPAWSPDSGSLVFGGQRPGLNEVSTVEIGTRAIKPVVSSERDFMSRSWGQSGLVFGSYMEGEAIRLAAVSMADPPTLHILTDEEVSGFGRVHGSPDGNWIAWIGGRGSTRGAFVSRVFLREGTLALAPERHTIPVEGPSSINWSPAGDELLVTGGDLDLFTVPVSRNGDSLTIGIPKALFRLPTHPYQDHISASPDGQRFYLTIEPAARTRSLSVFTGWRARLPD